MGYSPSVLQDRIEANFLVDLGEFDGYDIEEKMGDAAKQWKFNDTYYAVPTKQSADLIFFK